MTAFILSKVPYLHNNRKDQSFKTCSKTCSLLSKKKCSFLSTAQYANAFQELLALNSTFRITYKLPPRYAYQNQ
jgi:hypothetical protein